MQETSHQFFISLKEAFMFMLSPKLLLLLILTLLTQNTDFHNSNVRNKCQKDCQGESPLTTALRKE